MLATNPVTANLMKAREMIADEKNWCQGRYSDGHRHCARSALGIARNDFDPASDEFTLLDLAARQMVGSPSCLASMIVNDSLGHAAVMQMFDKAIELSLQPVSEQHIRTVLETADVVGAVDALEKVT